MAALGACGICWDSAQVTHVAGQNYCSLCLFRAVDAEELYVGMGDGQCDSLGCKYSAMYCEDHAIDTGTTTACNACSNTAKFCEDHSGSSCYGCGSASEVYCYDCADHDSCHDYCMEDYEPYCYNCGGDLATTIACDNCLPTKCGDCNSIGEATYCNDCLPDKCADCGSTTAEVVSTITIDDDGQMAVEDMQINWS